jgi:hypothetical protein
LAKFIVKIMVFCSIIYATDYVIGIYLKNGLIKQYGFYRGAEILCIGHSRCDHGIDKTRLEKGLNIPVAKYAVPGANTLDRLAMTRHYFSEHPQQVKVVVYVCDYFIFNDMPIGTERNIGRCKQLFPFVDNTEIDNYLKNSCPWTGYLPRKYIKSLRYNDYNVLDTAVVNHFKDPQIPYDKFDFGCYKSSLKTSKLSHINLAINIDSDTVKCFEETMEFLKSKNVKIILLFMPIVDLERDKIDKHSRDRVMTMLRQYSARDSSIIFIDDNRKYEESHELYYDPLHFNKYGQNLATDDLIKVIKSVM